VAELSGHDSSRLISRIKEVSGFTVEPPITVLTDTTEFMRIDRGQVIRLGGRELLVSGYVYEPRFGLEDQPKYWVKRGYDLDSGHTVIIKLEFYEEFVAHFGSFRIPCYRSPEKESEVLRLVAGDSRFMQGQTLIDDSGGNVRVLDFIRGKTLYEKILELEMGHEEYYHARLAPILERLVGCLEAIRILHDDDLYHGDIRSDHILIEEDTGEFRWIDFDLCQDVMFDPYSSFSAFDVWSFGNVLQLVVGMGLSTFHDIHASGKFPAEIVKSLKTTDAGAFHHHRLMNLKSIYPYISERLNSVLMRFSMGAEDYYWTVSDLMGDLCEAIPDVPGNRSDQTL
jgi:hypothetical protein